MIITFFLSSETVFLLLPSFTLNVNRSEQNSSQSDASDPGTILTILPTPTNKQTCERCANTGTKTGLGRGWAESGGSGSNVGKLESPPDPPRTTTGKIQVFFLGMVQRSDAFQ